MEQNELKEQEDKCTQESPPACTAGCPIHVDARKLMQDIQKQDLKSALKTLSIKQPFPGIIGRICDHPCEDQCIRRNVGTSIAIAALERFCVQNQTVKTAKAGIVPQKSQTVAVVGSGLRGLTVAYDLAKKGYKVSLFEKIDRLGGNLWSFPEDLLPPEVIVEELSVLNRLNVQIEYNTEITPQELTKLQEEYQVVYLGLAEKSNEALELLGEQAWVDPATCATQIPGLFSSALVGCDSPIRSVADGRKAAVSIDRYLQGVSLTGSRVGEGTYESKLYVNTKGMTPLPLVKMSHNTEGYTEEEAVQEASRCLNCQCLECVKACKYMEHYGSYPKNYLRQIYNNDTIVMGIRHGNKMINSCSLCGQCAVICPQGLDLGQTCKATRESMVSKGKMPASAHDFALRDMAFNNSEEFAFTRHQPGHNTSQYVFFPGCQLSASSPEQVEKVYAYLTEKLPGGVGLMLRCCGAPADWAGQQDLFQKGLEGLVEEWEKLGKPQLIVACSTCHSMFKDRFPKVVSLWALMSHIDLPAQSDRSSSGPSVNKNKVAVQDACTTRHEPVIHDAVRNILTKLGYEVEELPYNKERTKCCGFGGLTSFVNPELGKKIVEDRIHESQTDYVAYCAMCRDNFASQGKRTFHLLDLIFGTNLEKAANRPVVHGLVTHQQEALEQIQREDINVLVGIPTQVLSLARYKNSNGASVSLSLKNVLLSTDYVSQAIVQELETVWGCKVFNHYGMTEMGLGGGIECEVFCGYHLREADLYVEIIDPSSGLPVLEGQLGEVVVTTLTRSAMPLIRYRTGDMSRFIPGLCACKTVLKRLELIKSRDRVYLNQSDYLTMSDFDEALFMHDNVLDFDVILTDGMQAKEHQLQLEVQLKGPLSWEVKREVQQALHEIPVVKQARENGSLRTFFYFELSGGMIARKSTAKRQIQDQRGSVESAG